VVPLRGVAGGRFDGLEVGAAIARSRLSDDSLGPNGLRGRTVVTEDVFFAPVYVDGRRLRWEVDAEWLAGPAGLRSEFLQVTDTRDGQGIGGDDLSDARYRSWYVSGTVVLTGEDKTRPIEPRAPLFAGGAGAIEIAARHEHIRFDSRGGSGTPFRNPRAETILPSGNRVTTVGVNWILNRWIMVQADAIRERIDDEGRSPIPNGGAFWSRVLRVQFAM
jgi:phosphate-selective porin